VGIETLRAIADAPEYAFLGEADRARRNYEIPVVRDQF